MLNAVFQQEVHFHSPMLSGTSVIDDCCQSWHAACIRDVLRRLETFSSMPPISIFLRQIQCSCVDCHEFRPVRLLFTDCPIAIMYPRKYTTAGARRKI